MHDYKQNELIQDLVMKGVLYTRWDWIRRGRIWNTMTDLHEKEEHELYISMEGIPL